MPKNKTVVFLFHSVSVIVKIILKRKPIHDVSYPINDPGNVFFLLSMTAAAASVCSLMESKYLEQRAKTLFFSNESVLTNTNA